MISIVIPTMQKRLDILENLVKTLNLDNAVEEIIIINNAVKPLEFSYPKMRVITPETNIYVNPAWNLGVKEGVSKYIGLLNDDIIISPNLCSKILKEFEKNDKIGLLAFDFNDILPINDGCTVPEDSDFILSKTNFIAQGFGIAMFFPKEIYKPIPENLKIWFGDNYIFRQIKKSGYENYLIKGQEIYHVGSLSCEQFKESPLYKEDKKAWKKIRYKWYDYIFSIEEYSDCVKIRFLGLNLRLWNKN